MTMNHLHQFQREEKTHSVYIQRQLTVSFIFSGEISWDYLERVVGKNEKLETFKLESLKLENFHLGWKAQSKLDSIQCSIM